MDSVTSDGGELIKLEKSLNQIVSQIKSLLEDAGYEWEIEYLPTMLPEAKVSILLMGKNLGDVWIFHKHFLPIYYPRDCPAGGTSGEWTWTFDFELFDFLDYKDRELMEQLEGMTIDEINKWQLLTLPFVDINFKHYVGNQLVERGVCSNYKIDEESLQLLIPEVDLTIVSNVVNDIMSRINVKRKDNSREESDRFSQLDLFPLEEAG